MIISRQITVWWHNPSKRLTENWKKSASANFCCSLNMLSPILKTQLLWTFLVPPLLLLPCINYTLYFLMSWNDELLRKKKKTKLYREKKNQIKTISSIQDDNKQTVRSQVQIYDAWRCRCGQNLYCTVWQFPYFSSKIILLFYLFLFLKLNSI